MTRNRLKAFLEERSPFGNTLDRPFVHDALADPSLPDPTSWEELKDYIKRRNPNASADTLGAAEYVWQRYVEASHEPEAEV
jgi:hypothetical protein